MNPTMSSTTFTEHDSKPFKYTDCIAATDDVAKVSTHKDTRKGDSTEQQLPFRGLLDVSVMNNA